MKLFRFLIFLLIFPVLQSCEQNDGLSEIPRIFEGSYAQKANGNGRDTAIILSFSFEDGDGNIGLTEADSIPPYDRNLLVDYYQKENGIFKKILIPNTDDTLNLNSRILDFTNGKRGPLRGEVDLNINVAITLSDTVKFDYFIMDRDLNRSNKLSTGEIVLRR